MTSRYHTPWTPEEDAEVRRRVGLGHTALEISKGLKRHPSRSAVLGRMGRLGIRVLEIPGRRAAENLHKCALAAKKSDKKATALTAKHSSPKDLKIAMDKTQAWNAPAPYDDLAFLSEAIPLMRRLSTQCAWPMGSLTGADTLCCGQAITDGSYCEHHALRSGRLRPAPALVLEAA